MTTTAARPLTDLPANLRATLPRHIAFIADGNRRWAADHGLTVEQGYEAGTAAVHDAIQQCRDLGGVQAVSVFIASERNFDRPPRTSRPSSRSSAASSEPQPRTPTDRSA